MTSQPVKAGVAETELLSTDSIALVVVGCSVLLGAACNVVLLLGSTTMVEVVELVLVVELVEVLELEVVSGSVNEVPGKVVV